MNSEENGDILTDLLRSGYVNDIPHTCINIHSMIPYAFQIYNLKHYWIK